MLIPLSAKRRSELRAAAHALSPVVIIGDKGLTEVPITGTSPTLALIAGWLIPGAGHLLLGEWVRALLLAISIFAMVAIGIALQAKAY